MYMNNIKLKVFSIFLSVLSLCLISVCAYADKKEAIKSASEYDYPPYCLVSKDGRADGFSVELLRAALSAVDLGVEFKTGPWEQLKNELSEGTIQVLPLVGRTPEREAIYDFTFPYLSAHGAIFVRKGETRIKTVGDLADKTVVVMRGDNAEEYVRRKNISFNIITVDTYTEAFQLLNEGKYDAVIAQRLMGLQLLQNMKINTVISLDFIIHDFRQDFCFAVRDGDKELLSLLNEGLSIVIADGTFDKLQKKWFGPLLKHPLTFNDVMRYVLIVLIPISVIFILASVFLLRREVRNKTKNLHQEIAERKRSEEALQLSEVKFRSLAEQSITGTCIIQDGRFIYVNPRLAEILDFSQEEMIGMSVLDSVAESDRNMVRENIRKRLSGEISFIRYTFNALKKDGSSVPMEVHGSTMIYNGRPAIIATLLDITKRKQAEEAIFKEHNFNQLIIASAGEGICVCHEVGEFPYVRFTIWNDHMTAMTGYSMEEINRLGWYQSMYPDPVLQEQAIERMQRMRIGDNLQGEEWEITRADGQKRRLLITTNIISSGEGKPHILAVMNDITERKKAENALREAKEEIERWNRELENRVNEKTAELERTHKQLIQSEKLSAMGRLSAGLAHELNSPLAGLLPMIEKYRSREKQGTNEFRDMTLMLKACEYMARIIRDFNAFARRSEEEYTVLNINDVIESTLSFTADSIEKKGIRINRQYGEPLPDISGNKTELQQVVVNLLTNARDSMPDRGQLIIKTSVSVDKKDVIMEFIDTGRGIESENLYKIFDPFFTTKGVAEGTGLGLTVSYGIIKNHGGDISVESSPGKGSRFIVSLPAVN